jgi:DNA-binding transcriptional LysR family regulator
MSDRLDRLRQLVAFRRVVEHGSISAAARALHIGQPAVSKQVRALEQRLGVRLLERGTTRAEATPAGRALYAGLPALLDGIEQLEDDVSASARGLEGLLRVHVPVGLGELHLTAAFLRFQEKFPRIDLDVAYDDRQIDLVKERVDVALRIGPLTSPDLVVRKLAELPRALVATPRYLREAGTPRTPRELRGHNYVRNSRQAGAERIRLRQGDETVEVELPSRFLVDSVVALRDLLLAHVGLGPASRWVVHGELERGELVEVLPGWSVPPTVLHVVYPSGTLKTRRVTALVDFLAAHVLRLPGFSRA